MTQIQMGLAPTMAATQNPGSVVNFPGVPGIFDCFDSENQWDGIEWYLWDFDCLIPRQTF